MRKFPRRAYRSRRKKDRTKLHATGGQGPGHPALLGLPVEDRAGESVEIATLLSSTQLFVDESCVHQLLEVHRVVEDAVPFPIALVTAPASPASGTVSIRVNAIAPGYLDTKMSGGLDEDQKNQIIRRTPLGRLGTVEDIVPIVDFLLSPASAFMTGQTFTVDGGATV